MIDTKIDSDFLFYESGPRLYYVGRCGGGNSEIGWHTPGKMGGLWIDAIRILSSIWVKEGDQVQFPLHFRNHRMMKELVFSQGKLTFLAHASLPLFYLCGSSWNLNLKLWLETDATPVWLEQSRWEVHSVRWHLGCGSWQVREFRELGAAHSFFLEGDGVDLRFHQGCWVVSPTHSQWTLRISMHTPYSIAFPTAKKEKESWLVRNLPPYHDGIGYWAAQNALDLFMEREKGAGFAAGFPEFPWWFGIDSIYTSLGLLRTPMLPLVRKNIDNLLHYGNGLPVHEVTTAGKVYASKRMNELLAFLWLLIQYTDNTGEAIYTKTIERMIIHVLQNCDEDGFPLGQGIVEVPTPVAPVYLDCVCWWIAILKTISRPPNRFPWLEAAYDLSGYTRKVEKAFMQKWRRKPLLFFDIKSGMRMDYHGHFIQIYPLELGLVDPSMGKECLHRMVEEGYFSPYGLVHSLPIHAFDAGDYGDCTKNAMTWSLPAVLGLRAAKRYGMDLLAQQLRSNLENGCRHGMKGAIPEILPQPGLPNHGCIVQSWNGYLLQDDLWDPQSL